MENKNTLNKYNLLFLNLVTSLLVSYITACFVLQHSLNNGRYIYSFKKLKFNTINLYNQNSGWWFTNPGADVITYAIVMFISSFCLGLYLSRKKSTASDLSKMVSNFTSTVHGNAKFAEYEEIKSHYKLLSNEAGTVLAKITNPLSNDYEILKANSSSHTLIFGGTGSFKTTGPVLSTLLSVKPFNFAQLNQSEKRKLNSYIIFDLKNTFYNQTSGWLKKCGYRILHINAETIGLSQFNIFNEIDIDSPHFIEDIENIVDTITNPKGERNKKHGGDPFWDNSSKLFLCALIVARILSRKNERIKTSLKDIAYLVSGLDYYTNEKFLPKEIFENMLNSDNAYVKAAGIKYSETIKDLPKMIDSFCLIAITTLGRYKSNILGDITEESTFWLRDLFYKTDKFGNEVPPTAFYFNIPYNEIERLMPFAHLLLSFALKELSRENDDFLEKKYLCKIILDEFVKIGHFPKIGDDLGIMRGFAGQFILITQSQQDIDGLYGNDNSIFPNCDYKVVLGINELSTAKKLSEQSGYTTVVEMVPSMSVSKGNNGKPQKNESFSPQMIKKPLISPDEIIKLPSDEALVYINGRNPIRAKKIKYFEDSELLKRSHLPAPLLPDNLSNNKSTKSSIQLIRFEEN